MLHGHTLLTCPYPALQSFRLRDYAASVAAAGLELETFPIIEMQAPADMQAATQLIERIAGRLEQGQVLAMHCRCVVMPVQTFPSLGHNHPAVVCWFTAVAEADVCPHRANHVVAGGVLGAQA